MYGKIRLMKSNTGLLWHSIQPLIGSVIGVGIFGLPFAFAQAGFGIGLIHLVVLGVVNLLMLLIYADIVMYTDGHPRFTGIVGRYLGAHWSWAATLLMLGSIFGAMVAYVIVGGEFLHALFSPVVAASTTTYQVVFFAVCALLLIGGLGFISRLEIVFVLALLVMLFLILVGSLPYVDADHLRAVHPENWFLPFGVVLFAFGGMAAIPEMAQILGSKKRLLRRGILIGMGIVFLVYLAFSGIVVAVTGPDTSQEAILGLGAHVGNWVLMIGSVIGLFSVFTSFLILGIAAMDTLIYDYKWRYMASWSLVVLVPLLLFAAGARSFVGVIGFTGGLAGSLIGLLLIFTYIQAKRDVCTPKRCLNFPDWALFLCGCVFLLGAIATVVGA